MVEKASFFGRKSFEKFLNLVVDNSYLFKYNHFCACEKSALERYRSGHNEAVLKTVCPRGRVGSNPTLSAESNLISLLIFSRSTQEAEGTPLERVQAVNSGARVQIPPSAFVERDFGREP